MLMSEPTWIPDFKKIRPNPNKKKKKKKKGLTQPNVLGLEVRVGQVDLNQKNANP